MDIDIVVEIDILTISLTKMIWHSHDRQDTTIIKLTNFLWSIAAKVLYLERLHYMLNNFHQALNRENYSVTVGAVGLIMILLVVWHIFSMTKPLENIHRYFKTLIHVLALWNFNSLIYHLLFLWKSSVYLLLLGI